MPGGLTRPGGTAPKKAGKPRKKSVASAVSSAPAPAADAPVELDQDADDKRVLPTTELLLPAWPSAFSDRFSLVVSKRAFHGWVRQPSPCCAAASVAGAWCVVPSFRTTTQKHIWQAARLRSVRAVCEA